MIDFEALKSIMKLEPVKIGGADSVWFRANESPVIWIHILSDNKTVRVLISESLDDVSHYVELVSMFETHDYLRVIQFYRLIYPS
jgi:hypothetical protein